MQRHTARQLVLLAGLLIAAVAAHANAELEADPALAQCGRDATQALQKRYRDVKDIAADFVQTSQSVGLGGAQGATASSGQVVLQVPGKMRWSYDKPEPSLLVSDGKTLWLYDPTYGEAQKLPVGDGGYLSGAAIQFLLGKGDLEEEFEVRAQSCDATQAELKLTPRQAASYELLHIWLDPSTGLIQRTEVHDLLGNRTRVEFRNMQVNQQPDSGVFQFEPPDGVKVVELDP